MTRFPAEFNRVHQSQTIAPPGGFQKNHYPMFVWVIPWYSQMARVNGQKTITAEPFDHFSLTIVVTKHQVAVARDKIREGNVVDRNPSKTKLQRTLVVSHALADVFGHAVRILRDLRHVQPVVHNRTQGRAAGQLPEGVRKPISMLGERI